MQNTYKTTSDAEAMSQLVDNLSTSNCVIVKAFHGVVSRNNYVGDEMNRLFSITRSALDANDLVYLYDNTLILINEVVKAAAGNYYSSFINATPQDPLVNARLVSYSSMRATIAHLITAGSELQQIKGNSPEVSKVVRRGAKKAKRVYTSSEQDSVEKPTSRRPARRVVKPAAATEDYNEEYSEEVEPAKKPLSLVTFIDDLSEEDLMDYQNHKIYKVAQEEVESVVAKGIAVMLAPPVTPNVYKTQQAQKKKALATDATLATSDSLNDEDEDEDVFYSDNVNLGYIGVCNGLMELKTKLLSKSNHLGYLVGNAVVVTPVTSYKKQSNLEEYLLHTNLFNLVKIDVPQLTELEHSIDWSLIDIHLELERIATAGPVDETVIQVLENINSYLTKEINALLRVFYPTETIEMDSFIVDFPALVSWVDEHVLPEYAKFLLGTHCDTWEDVVANNGYQIAQRAISLTFDAKKGLIVRHEPTFVIAISSTDVAASLYIDRKATIAQIEAPVIANLITELLEDYNATEKASLSKCRLMILSGRGYDAEIHLIPDEAERIMLHALN